MENSLQRCGWTTDPLLNAYHDTEWGVPLHNDNKLFEFLVLEGMQAGLNWLTILRKRENFRKAFDKFDPKKVARYDKSRVGRLLKNESIIRNRLKIEAAIQNAKSFIVVQKEFGSFDSYIWKFVNSRPKINKWKTIGQIPAKTKESDVISADLKERGFRFVGSTICYAHMQATGMVNDHIASCFRYKECSK